MALAAEHHATEQILAELGLPHVLLRNGWYVENYTAQVPVHLEHGVIGAAGAGRISAAARADYAEAAAAALLADDNVGKVHELAGDESFTMADYAATLAEQAGQQVSYVDLPVNSTTHPAPSAPSSAGRPRRWQTSSRQRWSEASARSGPAPVWAGVCRGWARVT